MIVNHAPLKRGETLRRHISAHPRGLNGQVAGLRRGYLHHILQARAASFFNRNPQTLTGPRPPLEKEFAEVSGSFF